MSDIKRNIERMFMELAPKMCSNLTEYLSIERAICCRLHSNSLPDGMPVRGCGGCRLGTHQAIVDFHERGDIVCHAFQGQLVIDKEFASRLMYPETSFFDKSYARTAGFMKRYAAGSAIGFAAYGSGYCYVRMIITKLRSRTARILGPNPLVADVFRVYLVGGFPNGNSLVIRKVAEGQYHVANSRYTSTYTALAEGLLKIVNECPHARIGLDVVPEDEVGEYVVSTIDGGADSDGLVEIPSASGGFIVGFGKGVYHRMGIDDEVRCGLIYRWFSARGIFLNRIDVIQLMIVTTAAAHLKGEWAAEVKKAVKVWALNGDIVLKKYALLQIVGGFSSAAEYSAVCAGHTNKALAAMLQKSGMRSFCHVPMLAVDSEVNGSIFESIIGYLDLVIAKRYMRKLLRSLGMAGDGRHLVRKVEFPNTDLGITLNSHQYAVIKRMIENGQL